MPIERGAINLTGSQIPTAIQAAVGLGHSFRPCPKPLLDAKVLANFEDMFRGISNSTIALAEYGPAQPAPRLYLSTGGTLLPEDRDLSVELASANMEFKAVIDAAVLANPVGDASHKDMNRRNVTSGEGAAIKNLKSNSTKGKQITSNEPKICNPLTSHGSTVSQTPLQYKTKAPAPTDLLTMRSDKEPAASIIYRKQADALLAEELKAYIKIPNTTQHDIETGLSAQGHEIISDARDFADPNKRKPLTIEEFKYIDAHLKKEWRFPTIQLALKTHKEGKVIPGAKLPAPTRSVIDMSGTPMAAASKIICQSLTKAMKAMPTYM